jgi:hypothetical protein
MRDGAEEQWERREKEKKAKKNEKLEQVNLFIKYSVLRFQFKDTDLLPRSPKP